MTEQSQLDRSVEAVLHGNREADREVIAQCEANVRVVLAAILPDVEGIDDLAQEVFVTAYAKLPEFELGKDFGLWIKGIARHLALAALVSQRAVPRPL
jgi:RNA polymerase sigma-70 factor (ECF subfamily)